MKKVTISLALTLISAVLLACSIPPMGQCSGRSYFETNAFNPNSVYHIWITGTNDTLLTFTSGPVVTDSIFSLSVAPGTSLELSYSYLDNLNSVEHYPEMAVVAAEYEYAGCGVMPVALSNFTVQRQATGVTFSFEPGDETGVTRYDIMGNNDANDKDGWVLVKSVLPNGSHRYKITVPAGIVVGGIGIVLSGLMFFMIPVTTSKRRWIGLLSMAVIIFLFSCQREYSKETNNSFKYYHVETHLISGGTETSGIEVD